MKAGEADALGGELLEVLEMRPTFFDQRLPEFSALHHAGHHAPAARAERGAPASRRARRAGAQQRRQLRAAAPQLHESVPAPGVGTLGEKRLCHEQVHTLHVV